MLHSDLTAKEQTRPKKTIKSVRWNWLLYFAGLCILGAITFEGTLQLSYGTHDRDYMTDSAAGKIGHMFSAEKIIPGRPFFELLLWMQYLLWQDDIQLFHLTGVVLHLLASGFLSLILNQRNTALPISLTAGFLFLLNTAHFRAIHWVSAHCYPLALLCCFTAMYCFYRWLLSHRWQYVILTYLAALAGTLSHICAIVVLPMLWLDAKPFGYPKQTVWFLISLGLSSLLCILFITQYYPSAPQTTQAITNTEWNLTGAIVAFIFLLGRLVTTLHWLPFALYETHIWDYVLGVMTVLVAFILMTRYRSATNLYGLFWLLGGLAPFLLMNAHHIQSMQSGPSRYLYMAGVGAAILLANGVYSGMCFISSRFSLQHKAPHRAILYATPLFFTAASSIYYHRQSEIVSLYASARNDLATGYTETGVSQFRGVLERNNQLVDLKDAYERLFTPLTRIDLSEAARVATEGRRRFPESTKLILREKVIQSLQTTGVEQDEIVESIALLGQDSEISNALNMWYHNVSELKAKNGDLTAAVAALDILIRTTPKNSTTLWNSAVLYFQSGAYGAARGRLEEILAAGSTETKVLDLLARLCMHQNDFASAEVHIKKMLEIDPSNREAISLQEFLNLNTKPQ